MLSGGTSTALRLMIIRQVIFQHECYRFVSGILDQNFDLANLSTVVVQIRTLAIYGHYFQLVSTLKAQLVSTLSLGIAPYFAINFQFSSSCGSRTVKAIVNPNISVPCG